MATHVEALTIANLISSESWAWVIIEPTVISGVLVKCTSE